MSPRFTPEQAKQQIEAAKETSFSRRFTGEEEMRVEIQVRRPCPELPSERLPLEVKEATPFVVSLNNAEVQLLISFSSHD